MKKLFLVFTVLMLQSCSEEAPFFKLVSLAIDEAITPDRFTYRTSDTIVLKYTLPSACFYFKDVYYSKETQG